METLKITKLHDYAEQNNNPKQWGPHAVLHLKDDQLSIVLGTSKKLEDLYYKKFSKKKSLLSIRSFTKLVSRKLSNVFLKTKFSF